MGKLQINSSDAELLHLVSTNGSNYIRFNSDTERQSAVGYYNGAAFLSNEKGNYARLAIADNGTPQYWSNNYSSTAKTLLHAGNYSSYALPLSGGTMSGAITMNVGTGIQMKYEAGKDTRWIYPNGADTFGIRYYEGEPDRMAISASGNNNDTSKADLCINGNGDGTVTIRGKTILHAGNYTSYTVTKTGSGASGTWGINITGNAATCSYPAGFCGNEAGSTWGAISSANYTCFAQWIAGTASDKGGIAFMGYPSQSQISIKIDGYLYQNEGNYRCLDTTNVSGTANKIAKFTSTNYIGNSNITDDGSTVTIGSKLVVKGNGSSYNEGIRVLPASNGWSNIFFSANSTTEGTHDGGWLIGRRGAAGSLAGAAGDFTIEEQDSSGANLTIYKNSGGARLMGTFTANGAVLANRGYSASTNGYGQSALEIREYGFGGAQSDTWGMAPRLSFHWAGRVCAQIGLASNGILYINNNANTSTAFVQIQGTAGYGSSLPGSGYPAGTVFYKT